MTDPLTFLTTALDAAQRDAEAATPGPWTSRRSSGGYRVLGGPNLQPEIGSDNRTVCRTDAYPPDWPTDVVNMAADVVHIARHDPQATLRRIAAERKTLAACEEILAVDGWEYDDTPNLADDTIRNMAEGWGWTEETT